MDKLNLVRTSKLALTSIIAFSMFYSLGCNKPTQIKTPPPVKDVPLEVLPEDPIQSEPATIQDPTDTPEPLPAPTTAAVAGQTIIAKAIAKTTAYKLPLGGINGVYVNVEVTWQPVTNAKEYWLFKGNLPTKEQVNRGGAYKVIKASSILSTYFLDGAQPPSFSEGNLWDKVKKGFGAYTLKPGVEYKYKVFAVDMDNNVLGESDAAVTIPLPPIAAPTNIKLSETNTIQPLFQWDATDGVPADGYFVSVMPPINFGKEKIPNTSVGYAFWTTYRNEKTKLARYGQNSDNAMAYPGSLPFNITTPLKIGGRYSVSVTAIKTDTNDMRTAKALSKAWGESKLFSLGTLPNNPATSTPNTDPNAPASPAPSPSSAPKESLLDKAKKLISFF